MPSSVVVQVPSYGYTYSFSGVISVQHEFTLKIQTDSESETGTDYVNGARNQPDKVTLTVRESDVGHAAGWSDRMLQALESIKRKRLLCNVVTSAKTYSGMLLMEFSATIDEESQSGWEGTLAFMKCEKPGGEAGKMYDNSSAAVHVGSAGPVQAVSNAPGAPGSAGTSSPLNQLLARAGVQP